MTPTDTGPAANRWAGASLDAAAFALGLFVAWWWGWNTTDLVWSLWLSSLVVGYAIIVWSITAPLREVARGLAGDRMAREEKAGATVVMFGLVGAGTLFGLVFFTVHFGGFHFVHSIFLNMFFPLVTGSPRPQTWPGTSLYAEVVWRYWWFLPAAAIAERAAFRPKPAAAPDTAVTPVAIARRIGRADPMMAPYRNVIRMHLLIFFFAFAHFARLESLGVYAVVYAVYFFPWRVLRPAAARS